MKDTTPSEIELKQKIKKLIDSIEGFKNNTRLINAVTRFVIDDRQSNERS